MKKPTKRETLNLVLSAFLILGYIVCTYFFLTVAASAAPQLEPYVQVLVFLVFGLVVFYATRIGDGKQVKRFSIATLIVLDIPALYAILAYFMPKMPLHGFIANLGGTSALAYSPILILACIALGYGIPYTFLSGYEEKTEDEAEAIAILDKALEAFEEEGEPVIFAICDKDDEGALLVVDDIDPELDGEKEIRQMYAITMEGVAPVGSFVKLVETDCAELDVEDNESETEE
ncbi:MAG: hypothetical protein IJ346_02740 [Clostridia bacterium]|nr:hypothetical protein [Clostridia bacterium]